MTRIVFLGTPESAVPTLARLAERFEVGLVVTQPDKPKGRSSKPRPSPVKEKAVELGVAIAQPERSAHIAPAITASGPFDLGVVVAYGRILRPDVLELPREGLLNVHFSLLPRWRGAAPVARALMAGDSMTGVTIIKIDEGLDTGAVLTAQAVDIQSDENAGDLTDRLATLGARLIADAVPVYMSGDLRPITQTDDGLEYAEKITPVDRILDPATEPAPFVNRVRALAPNPGATLEVDGERFKILEARVVEHSPGRGRWKGIAEGLVVAVGSGAVELITVQPPGRNRMSGAEWLRGVRKDQGEVG